MPNPSNKSGDLKPFILAFALIIITYVVFQPTLDNGFVDYDDGAYLLENSMVKKGITLEGAGWAFTSLEHSNWHPLTWLSHMLDVEMHGLDPAGHHLTSLIFHLANTVLVFYLFLSMTGEAWKSAALALLFAIHPLHVESVAWMSERKDVLSAFFGLLALIAYVRYARRPGFGLYLLTALFLGLGLMSKPMPVTLPLVMLLFDYWPLGRAASPKDWLGLVKEKIPLLLMSAASCIITLKAQWSVAVAPVREFGLVIRFANTLLSYAWYVIKTFYPIDLAVPYPLPLQMPVRETVGSAILLAVICLAVIIFRKKRYITVGWLMFTGMLVPVIGLVQVGMQARADRYTYLPLIGLFIIVVWGAAEVFRRKKHSKLILTTLGLIAFFLLAKGAMAQVKIWKDTITLFSHATEKTNSNYVAYNKLAMEYLKIGKREQALAAYKEILKSYPQDAPLLKRTGLTLLMMGKNKESEEYFKKSLSQKGNDPETHNGLGGAVYAQGRLREALAAFERAVELDPKYAEALKNAAVVRQMLEQAKTTTP